MTNVTSYLGVAHELEEINKRIADLREWVRDHDVTVNPGDLNPVAYYVAKAVSDITSAAREAAILAEYPLSDSG